VWEEATGPSGSEEDLLSDKPSIQEVKPKTKKKSKNPRFQPQESREDDLMKDSGSAPRFVTILSPTTELSDGKQARFEVKVEAYPRSVVRWYLNGKEMLPSKDFVIDNLEDGTSILSINEVFPDDIGELMCEAQNENGIATTTTQLNLIGYKDTPVYRKPEWVTRMELARAHMLASQQPPQFTTEVVDRRVQESETAIFECYFAGNPKPGIYLISNWSSNQKLILKVVQIFRGIITVNY